MKQDTTPDNSSHALSPIKSWEDVPKLPPDHWIYQQGPQVTCLGGLTPSETQNEKKHHHQ